MRAQATGCTCSVSPYHVLVYYPQLSPGEHLLFTLLLFLALLQYQSSILKYGKLILVVDRRIVWPLSMTALCTCLPLCMSCCLHKKAFHTKPDWASTVDSITSKVKGVKKDKKNRNEGNNSKQSDEDGSSNGGEYENPMNEAET